MTFALNGRGQGVSFHFISFIFFVCSGGFEGEIERRKKGGKSHFYKIFTLTFLEAKKIRKNFLFFSCFLPVIVGSLVTPVRRRASKEI